MKAWRSQKQEEASRLAALRDEMSPDQLDAVAKKAARLKEIQSTPDSPRRWLPYRRWA